MSRRVKPSRVTPVSTVSFAIRAEPRLEGRRCGTLKADVRHGQFTDRLPSREFTRGTTPRSARGTPCGISHAPVGSCGFKSGIGEANAKVSLSAISLVLLSGVTLLAAVVQSTVGFGFTLLAVSFFLRSVTTRPPPRTILTPSSCAALFPPVSLG